MWGAGLSTLLALVKLLHPRPIVYVEFERFLGSVDPSITVTNVSRHPMMLVDVTTPIGGRCAIQTASIEGRETVDVVKHALSNKLNVLLQPNATLTFTVRFEQEPKGALLFVLWWRSHRLIAWPTVPSIRCRSAAEVRSLMDNRRARPISKA